MPRVAIVCALAPLIINACGGHEPRETGRQSARAAGASAPQATSFAGTTAPAQRTARPGTPPRVLRSVAATSGPGYDRVVFEFAEDSVPGYHVEYTTKPVRRCGSGDPVTVAGGGELGVGVEPPPAPDQRGHSPVGGRGGPLGLPRARGVEGLFGVSGQGGRGGGGGGGRAA